MPAWLLLMTLVFVGSAVGGALRYVLSNLVQRQTVGAWPAGTMVVNVSGAFAIGLVWSALGGVPPGPELAAPPEPMALRGLAGQFLMLGLLGGYTTVSTFALDSLGLLHQGRRTAAALNLLGSWGLCLLAAAAGVVLGAWAPGA